MADRYFVGDSDQYWDVANNWASSSGGSGGAGVPGSADTAIFDGNSPDCTGRGATTITKLDVQAAFSNTLDGFDSAITTTGDLLVDGGTVDFGAGSHDVTVGGDMKISGGTVTMPVAVPTGGTLDVTGTLDISGGSFAMLTCDFAVGDIDVKGGAFTMGAQDHLIRTTTAGEGFFQSGGAVTLTSGTLECRSDFERSAGTLTHNSGTVLMFRVTAADHDLDVNGATLYNVTITYGAYGVDVDSAFTIAAGGLLKLVSLRGLEGTATITLLGDMESQEPSTNFGTRNTIEVAGTGAQEIRTDTGTRVFPISGLKINKASGTLTFTNGIKLQGNTLVVEYVQGAIDWSACSEFQFNGHHSTAKCTADFTIGERGTTLLNLLSDAFDFTVDAGDLYCLADLRQTSVGATFATNGGRFFVRGDDCDIQDGVNIYGQTLPFIVDGTGDQTFRSSTDLGQIGPFIIDKDPDDGTLTLSGEVAFVAGSEAATQPTFDYIQGTVDASAFTVNIGGGDVRDSQKIRTRDLVLNDVKVALNASYSLTLIGPCLVGGKLTIETVANISQDATFGGYFEVRGDFESNEATLGGDCPIYLRGTGAQSVLCNGGDLPNADFIVDKPSGTATLGEDFAPASWTGNFTVTRGEIDFVSYAFNIGAQTLTVGAYGKVKLKGNQTITTGATTCQTGSTVEYYDGALAANLLSLASTYYDLELGASKTHNVTASARLTVNGAFKSNGTSSTRAILRSTIDDTQWELDLQGASWLEDAVDVKDSDASFGKDVFAIDSLDSGNNSPEWIFSAGGGRRPRVRAHNV